LKKQALHEPQESGHKRVPVGAIEAELRQLTSTEWLGASGGEWLGVRDGIRNYLITAA